MNKKYSIYISGAFAFIVYILLLVVLISFDNKESIKTKHYVKKVDNTIEVSLLNLKVNKINKVKSKSLTRKSTKYKNSKNIIKKKPIVEKKKKEKKKKVILTKTSSKQKNDLNVKNKKSTQNSKKIKDLFSIISTNKTPVSTKNSEKAKKQKSRDVGIKNAYFAKIENILKGWPAQSNFAGEMVKVWFKINTNGSFTFKIITASNNALFNQELLKYLSQLQKFGFGKHNGLKAYELDVEFIATQ